MDEKEKSSNDAWLATMMTLLSTSLLNNPIKDTTLEKEVAYLNGKIDVLEKIVLEKCK